MDCTSAGTKPNASVLVHSLHVVGDVIASSIKKADPSKVLADRYKKSYSVVRTSPNVFTKKFETIAKTKINFFDKHTWPSAFL